MTITFFVNQSDSRSLHIFHPFHQTIPAIPNGIQERRDRTEVFLNEIAVIAPFEFISQEEIAEEAPFRAKRSQVLW